jgi:hypothetical protein
MSLLFRLEPVGGRRRVVRDAGGATPWTADFLGPAGLVVEIRDAAGGTVASLRGGSMAVPDFRVALAGGERLRVYAGGAALVVASDRRADAAARVVDGRDGWRGITFEDSRGIAGVLRHRPLDGAEPWHLEVPSFGEPLRALAALLAAERFLREREFPPGPPP